MRTQPGCAALALLAVLASAGQADWRLSFRAESCDSACARYGYPKNSANSKVMKSINDETSLLYMHSFFNCPLNGQNIQPVQRKVKFSPGYQLQALVFTAKSKSKNNIADQDTNRMCCCGTQCDVVYHNPPLANRHPECFVFANGQGGSPAAPAPIGNKWALSYKGESCIGACDRKYNLRASKTGNNVLTSPEALNKMHTLFNCGNVNNAFLLETKQKWAPAYVASGSLVYNTKGKSKIKKRAFLGNRICCCSEDKRGLCPVVNYNPRQPAALECGQ